MMLKTPYHSGDYRMLQFKVKKVNAIIFTSITALPCQVNRGQGISAFGIKNKDGGIAKFNTAEKAYQQTPFLRAACRD